MSIHAKEIVMSKPGVRSGSSSSTDSSLTENIPSSSGHSQEISIDTPKKVRNRTKYNDILVPDFNDRVELSLQVIPIIKMRLAGKEPNPKNVFEVIRNWIEEQEMRMAVQAGILVQPAVKDAAPAPESGSKVATTIDSPLLLAYLTHALTIPSIIADEVRYFEISDSSSSKEAETAGVMANDVWNAQIVAKKKALGDMVAKVEEWFSISPEPLTYQQMNHRDQLRSFEPLSKEDKETRDEARSKVRGFQPVSDYREDAAVAWATEKRFSAAKQTAHRQMSEHTERERILMQKRLGILPISATRQEGLLAKAGGLVGIGKWQNDFETEILEVDKESIYADYPVKKFKPKPSRARLDPDLKRTDYPDYQAVTYPERRTKAVAVLEDAVPKRFFAHSVFTKDPELVDIFKSRLEKDKAEYSDKSKDSNFTTARYKQLMELDKDKSVEERVKCLQTIEDREKAHAEQEGRELTEVFSRLAIK